MDRRFSPDIPENIPDDLCYLTEQQVAAITGRSIAALRNDRLNRVGIPFHKIGRSVRYLLSDVKAHMAGCRRPTGDYVNRLTPPEV